MMAKFEAGIDDGWMNCFVVNPETGEEIKEVVWINEDEQVLARYDDFKHLIHHKIEKRPCLLVHEVL